MSHRKFDTCFFERYARTTLESILGPAYSDLVNEDRPDLQMPDRSLGSEVTRAMDSNKHVAQAMRKDGRYIGSIEYEYWQLAHPLRRIIESKVSKVGSGFYGSFSEYGLYIFCKDDLSYDEVILTMEYTSDLQRHLDIRYSTMYLSLIDKLYVCDLTSSDSLSPHNAKCTSYDISRKMCKDFFLKAMD